EWVDFPGFAIDRHDIEMVEQQQRFLRPVAAGETDHEIGLACRAARVETCRNRVAVENAFEEIRGLGGVCWRIHGFDPNVLLQQVESLPLDLGPVRLGPGEKRGGHEQKYQFHVVSSGTLL